MVKEPEKTTQMEKEIDFLTPLTSIDFRLLINMQMPHIEFSAFFFMKRCIFHFQIYFVFVADFRRQSKS